MPAHAFLQDDLQVLFDEDGPVEMMDIFDTPEGTSEKSAGPEVKHGNTEMRKRKKLSAKTQQQEAAEGKPAPDKPVKRDDSDEPVYIPGRRSSIQELNNSVERTLNGHIKITSSSGLGESHGNTLQGRVNLAGADAHTVVQAGGGVTANVSGLLGMIDTFDRQGDAFAKGTYAGTKKFAVGLKNKSGERLPKAGVRAEAGVGHARAEWSVFDAEAKGPNASAGAEASTAFLGARAYARAELASASATAGPLRATASLALDTGISVSLTQLELKVLGTGISFGSKMGISLFGTGFEFNLW